MVEARFSVEREGEGQREGWKLGTSMKMRMRLRYSRRVKD